MTTTTKLATAALAGLMAVGMLVAQPALAGEHEKGSCKAKSGCKGKAAAHKSESKAHSEKASCKGADKAKEANSCTGKDKEEGESK